MVRQLAEARVRVDTIEECKEFLQREEPVKTKVKKVFKPLRRILRSTTTRQRQVVVQLKQNGGTWIDIARLTGIHVSTVRGIYSAFIVNGTCVPKRSTGRRPWDIPDDVSSYLLGSLHDDKFLSLRDRCSLINSRFGYPMTLKQLTGFYKRNKIACLRAKSVYRASLRNPPGKKRERRDFA